MHVELPYLATTATGLRDATKKRWWGLVSAYTEIQPTHGKLTLALLKMLMLRLQLLVTTVRTSVTMIGNMVYTWLYGRVRIERSRSSHVMSSIII